ncbi:hypothetical protein GCM10011391_22460 [Pullulanibacillus camelliae]|uniref:YrhC family protein n=1 Tax=Pullulanibacillus camelliae TaxID=1707096 RepID=A0A8J2YHJ3_9BACL|nr:YrhC family protein [Pullulanibacillus camelliae]GGE43147.1 hypothetical protein GCM10011391_22460 [Pullulanibacillus camelliae]
MTDREKNALKLKVVDFRRFGFIFLFLGAFLFMGSVLPFENKTIIKADILVGASLLMLLISILFLWRMKRAAKQYDEQI